MIWCIIDVTWRFCRYALRQDPVDDENGLGKQSGGERAQDEHGGYAVLLQLDLPSR